jgi:mono/diheme cytochrome c family protein
MLKDWVLNGKPPGAMPPFKDTLTDAEVDAVLSHIRTWWPPGQRESQADISRRYQEALDEQGRSE